MTNAWVKESSVAVTVCDRNGIILEMNEKSCRTFEKYGGVNLVGSNLLDCHPEPAKSKLAAMLKNPAVRSYSIEKQDIKKLIHQMPWYDKGVYMGFVELSIEIPLDMPNFVRTA